MYPLNVFVLYFSKAPTTDNSAIRHLDKDRLKYYPQFKLAERKLLEVFGDGFQYNLLNTSEFNQIPDEKDIDILVIPEWASLQDFWFGLLWQKRHPDCLVIFNCDQLIRKELVRNISDKELKIIKLITDDQTISGYEEMIAELLGAIDEAISLNPDLEEIFKNTVWEK